jgi:hypothetical protein
MRDKATEDVRQVVDALVQEASQSLASDMKSNESDTDRVEGAIPAENLLDHLLTSGCSKELVRHECLNILLAARDTTASLLSSCIYELARESARKSEMWRMLKEEVERLGSGIDGLLTLDQVREMKYLRALLNESLRSASYHSSVNCETLMIINIFFLLLDNQSDFIHLCGQTRVTLSKMMCCLLEFSFLLGVYVEPPEIFKIELTDAYNFGDSTDCRFLIREFQRNPEVWGKVSSLLHNHAD